jgi:anti-sigma factor RsiW
VSRDPGPGGIRGSSGAGHLGSSLSALVDGELDHEERERVFAHLAGCAECRMEAEGLRRLKRRLAALGDVTPPEALLARLRLVGEPGLPMPPRPRGRSRSRRALPRPGAGRPGGPGAGRSYRRPRGRYVAAGVTALVLLGIGAASYADGGEPSSLPRVTPAVREFAVEHAMTVGDMPDTGGMARNAAGRP